LLKVLGSWWSGVGCWRNVLWIQCRYWPSG